jgi:ribosomal protein L37AE/L43A
MREKAAIETLCNLLETEPLRMMDARNDSSLKELAQDLENLGRPLAAERLRAGWEIIKKKFYEGMQVGMRSLQGQPSVKPSNGPTSTFLQGEPPMKGPNVVRQTAMMVPVCIQCMGPVMDYQSNDIPLCSKCRTSVKGSALIPIIETELANRQTALDRMTGGIATLKERLTALKASPNR